MWSRNSAYVGGGALERREAADVHVRRASPPDAGRTRRRRSAGRDEPAPRSRSYPGEDAPNLDSKAVLITGLLDRHRPGDRRASRRARAHGLRDGAPGRDDRRPGGRRAARPWRSTSPTRRRCGCGGPVVAAEGAVGALVNNAGYSQSGARRDRRHGRLRRQFETNVFGLVRMCQLVLPGMREPALGADRQHQLDGRELHVPGRRHLPRDQVRGGGHLRRAALRGQGFGVDVVIIEPGLIRTEFGKTAAAEVAAEGRRPVRASSTRGRQATTKGAYEKGPMAKFGGGPRPWPRRSRGRSQPAARRPATASRLGAKSVIGPARDADRRLWDRSCGRSSRSPARSNAVERRSLGWVGLPRSLEQRDLAVDPAAVADERAAAPTTRWHGTMIGIGLAFSARPAARAALGLPAAARPRRRSRCGRTGSAPWPAGCAGANGLDSAQSIGTSNSRRRPRSTRPARGGRGPGAPAPRGSAATAGPASASSTRSSAAVAVLEGQAGEAALWSAPRRAGRRASR